MIAEISDDKLTHPTVISIWIFDDAEFWLYRIQWS